jgi:hypothetical protein
MSLFRTAAVTPMREQALPGRSVAQEQKHRLAKAKTLQAAVAVWNDFNSKMGSFSDEYIRSR